MTLSIRSSRNQLGLFALGMLAVMFASVFIAPSSFRLGADRQPRGTIATIPISSGGAIDGGLVAVDSDTNRAFVLAQNSEYTAAAGRQVGGMLSMLDGRKGTILNTSLLNFYPVALATGSQLNHGFIIAGTAFGIDAGTSALHVLDLRTGTIVQIVGLGAYITDAAVDGHVGHVFVAEPDNQAVEMVDARRGILLQTIKLGQAPVHVVLSEDTDRLFISCVKEIIVLDTRTGAIVGRVNGTLGDTYMVDERTQRLFSTTGGVITTRDARQGLLLYTAKAFAQIDALAISTGTNRIFAASSGHNTVSVINARTGNVLATVTIGFRPIALAVDAHLKRVLVVCQGDSRHRGALYILDATSGRVVDTFSVGSRPVAIAINALTNRAFVLNADSGTVSVLDLGVSH